MLSYRFSSTMIIPYFFTLLLTIIVMYGAVSADTVDLKNVDIPSIVNNATKPGRNINDKINAKSTKENATKNENKAVMPSARNYKNEKDDVKNIPKSKRNEDKNKADVIEHIFEKIEMISDRVSPSNKRATEEIKNRLSKALRFLGRRAGQYENLIVKLVSDSVNARRNNLDSLKVQKPVVKEKRTNKLPNEKRQLVYEKFENETYCGCKCIAQQMCPRVKSLNALTCKNGGRKLSLDKLCDGIYDCLDQSDEEHCASKAINKLQETKKVITDAETKYIEKCFQSDAISGVKSRSFKKVLLSQIAFLNQYDNHPILLSTLEGIFKDRVATEKAANEAAVVISMVATALEGAICIEHLVNEDDYDSTINKISESSLDNIGGDGSTYSVRWSTASCSCSDYNCVNYNCTETCKTICRHKYMLNQFICEPVNGINQPSIQLDLICDGKIDCLDESDEDDCREGNSYSKFQATEQLNNVLKLVRSKIGSKEYEPVQSRLLGLYSDITEIQKVQSDHKAVKYVRDLIFKTFGHLYGVMVDTTHNAQQEAHIFEFFESLNKKFIKALKNSLTGNERLVPANECSCRGAKCNIPNCPSSCVRTCFANSVLTRLVCKGPPNNISAAISVVCDGRKDCPHGDDEENCKTKVLCLRHHLFSLRAEVSRMVKAQEGNLLGAILKSWNSKLTENLKKAEKLPRPSPRHVRMIVDRTIAELVTVYSGLDENVNDDKDLELLTIFAQKIISFIKVCGK